MNATPELVAATARLSSTFIGQVLQPSDPGYDEARRVHNGMIDKHPAVVARCRGLADLVDAVNLAHEGQLEVAIRGGGHNVAGRAAIDGGLMIDLSLMKGIHVDPIARVARAQGGVTWNEFNRETQLYGLATTGGAVSTTGIAGLTLGGGHGWLLGKHGLALDNLLSADVILADGRVVLASEREYPDLFWALRGGGGNFGVVASFEYRVHPVGPMLTGGLILYPFSAAWDVLRHYRDITASPPDELTVFAGLIHDLHGSGEKLVGIVACYCGDLADGEIAVQKIKQFGTPEVDAIGPIAYTKLNTMLDAAYPSGARNYWKSSILPRLSDDAIRAIIDCFAGCPAPMGQILLEHFHGAFTRVGITDTAFPNRAESFNLLVLSEWMEPAQDETCISWARNTYCALQPFLGDYRYVNYLSDDDARDAVAIAYGPNYRRLQEIKAKYDPDNFFHMNPNIRPAI